MGEGVEVVFVVVMEGPRKVVVGGFSPEDRPNVVGKVVVDLRAAHGFSCFSFSISACVFRYGTNRAVFFVILETVSRLEMQESSFPLLYQC